ncbi:conjugative relaxase (plasmid) [Edwardsiella tarda]|uniref:MobF family relaxase n=1 Tax=Edwardsiella tarda TaxID=636 RepID=UPI001D0510B1|nr:MobF family relaxase [Edwardsiella tarda]UCQ29580.1 conjugative relaxase [Edwardsiella tarda]
MLSIAPIAGGGAGYYVAQDNYYFLGSLQSRWLGEGARVLGLTGAVLAPQLDEMLAGRLPDGSSLERQVEGKNAHRAGYDLTFSAPKSVSVLVNLYGDTRLLAAHNRAVEMAAREVETLVGTRVMQGGVSESVTTGKMVAALFNHDTSRELDPQLHTHVLLMNATEHEGAWRTLSSDTRGRSGTIDALYDNKIALGQIYRQVLRQEVERLGFTVEQVGKHGLWEIAGVPTAHFSQRSQQIQAAVGDDASMKSRDIAALDTRKGKQHVERDELLTEWHQRMATTGFDYAGFQAAAVSRAKSVVQGDVGQDTSTRQWTDIRQAVGQAISLLSDKQIQFTYSEVLSRTLNQADVMPGSIALARKGIDEAIEQGTLIPLDREKGVFTSAIHLLDELSVQHLARQRLQASPPLVLSRSDTAPVGVMAQIAATMPNVARVTTGASATAQQASVTAAVALAEGQGRTVQVMASDGGAHRFLQTDARLAPRMVAKSAVLSAEPLPADSTLVVAGAERLSVKETLTLLDAAQRSNVQLLLMDGGGRKGTGNALATLTEAGVPHYHAEPASKAVAVSVVSEPDKRQRYTRLAEDYARHHANGEAVVAQAPGESTPA